MVTVTAETPLSSSLDGAWAWRAPPASPTRASTSAGTAIPRWPGLLDQARSELDNKKRAALYRQIDKIIMEDAGFFPICNDLNLVVLSPKKGFVNPPEEWFQLWTPWVEA